MCDFARHFSPSFEVQTVAFLGWKGKSNGDLLHAAEENFDVLVTLDTRLSSQQNLSEYDIAVIVLRPRTQKLHDLIALVPLPAPTLLNLRTAFGGPEPPVYDDPSLDVLRKRGEARARIRAAAARQRVTSWAAKRSRSCTATAFLHRSTV